jgi:type IV pilus assembly protein PilO
VQDVSIKRVVYIAVPLLILFFSVGYGGMIRPSLHYYATLIQNEQNLKTQFEQQQQHAAQQFAYQKQLQVLRSRFGVLLKQFSTRNTMPGLLEDISQRGIESGLTFDVFAPLSEQTHVFYKALQINLVVTGEYQQFVAFVSRLAEMRQFVTLHHVEIIAPDEPLPSGQSSISRRLLPPRKSLLIMKMIAKVYWIRETPSQLSAMKEYV